MRLRAAYAGLRRRSHAVFAPLDLTSDQYVLLTVLARGGTATQQELARRCASESATIAAMVSLLETRRLVEREPHPEDGRAWRVGLTPAGARVTERMRRRSAGLRANLAALFAPAEFGAFLEYLDRVAGALTPPARRSRSRRARAAAVRPTAPRRPAS